STSPQPRAATGPFAAGWTATGPPHAASRWPPDPSNSRLPAPARMPLRLPRERANVDSSRHLTTFRAHWWLLDGFRPGFPPDAPAVVPAPRCPSAPPQSACRRRRERNRRWGCARPGPPKRSHSTHPGRPAPEPRAAPGASGRSAPPASGQESGGGQGGGLGPQDVGAEPETGPGLQPFALLSGQPTLGADDHEDLAARRLPEDVGPIPAPLRHHDGRMAGQIGQRPELLDLRQARPPALASGFPGDAPPALHRRRPLGRLGPGDGALR